MRSDGMKAEMTGTGEAAQRLAYLDAVRAFALLLGIVFHASLSFLPVFIGWAVMDVSTSQWVGAFTLVSHAFRMELFFLIAGFFSSMTLQRKGLGAFLASRLVRIGVPFLVGWFILRPLIVSGWVMGGESLRGDVDVVGGLVAGFRSLSELPQDLFTGTHLWFLYYLLLITALVLLVRTVASRLPLPDQKVNRGLDALVHWLAHSRLALPVLAAPTAGLLWFMQGWGMDTPDRSLAPHWPVLGVYTLCFGVGWLLCRGTSSIARFARLTAGRGLLVMAAMAACLVLAPYQMDTGHPRFEVLRGVFVVNYAIMMWGLVMLSIGVFKRFLDRPSPTVRYLADASYWLYLVHLPLVIWLQIVVAELPVAWSLKLAGISVVTVALSLVVYDRCVRPTLIGQVLNGRRKAPVLILGRFRSGSAARAGHGRPEP